MSPRSPFGRAARRVFAPDLSLRRVEWSAVFLALVIAGIGVVFVREMALADLRYDRAGIRLDGHLKKLFIAIPLLPLGLLVRARFLRRRAVWFYVVALVLLLLVPIVGEERNYARRWIHLPIGFDLQPSELAKLGLVLALATALDRNRLERLQDWFTPVMLALVPIALVFLQPDLGTALTIVPITLGMLYLAGARGKVVTGIVAVGVVAGLFVWKLELVQDYQIRRIDVWASSFDPEALKADRNGASFHTYHSRTTIGNGGWKGTGLGEGIANRAGHLPERESDSILAVLAEEAGLIGAAAFLFLYSLLIAVLLLAAGAIRERFSRLVVGGVAIYLGSHFFVHAGVNLGLVPMTGLPLPLVSTGGSSLFTTFLALGLALGAAARWEPPLDEDAFRV